MLAPAASRKLWEIISTCEMKALLTGTSRRDYLRNLSNQHIGQTRQVLRKLANMQEHEIDEWMEWFIRWMNEKEESNGSV